MEWHPPDSPAPETDRRSLALFVATAFLFGTGFVGIEAGLATLPPVFFAALRFDVAALVLIPVLLARRDRTAWRPAGRRDWDAVLVAATLMFALNGALLFVGQRTTTAGAAAVTYGLVPVLAPVFATRLLPTERLGGRGMLGVLLGLLGVVVVVNPSAAALTSGGIGQLLVAGAATSVALGSVLLRWLEPELGSVAVTAWGMALGALALHGLSLALGERLGAVPTTGWLAVLYVGVVATGFAFPLYFTLIRRAGAVRANMVSYAIPVVTTALAWALLGERPAPTTALGFFIIAAGFALLEARAIRDAFGRE